MHRLKRIFQHLGYPMATSKTLSLTCQIKCRCSHISCNEAWVGSDIQRVCARLLLSGRDATEPCLEVNFLKSSPWLKYLQWVLMSLYKPLLGPWLASLFPPKKIGQDVWGVAKVLRRHRKKAGGFGVSPNLGPVEDFGMSRSVSW